MSKAVMQAIRPEWCEKIIRGEKTIDARKTHPDQETPFKVYIYCTIGKKTLYRSSHDGAIRLYHKAAPTAFAHHQVLNGKVIGEYVCDKLVWVVSHPSIFAGHTLLFAKPIKYACLTNEEAEHYSGGKDVYGWHISQLKIYDQPKDLVAFCKPCERQRGSDCRYCKRHSGNKPILRPPQSWCYVEEV